MPSIRQSFRPAATVAWLATAALLTLSLACRPAEERQATPGEAPEEAPEEEAAAAAPIENGALGIALAGVPPGFEVARNEGEDLVLVRTGEDDEAVLTFELTAVQAAGVNLVERVWQEKERIEALPEGQYRGQNELGGVPLGTTFTSRGRFVNDEGERVEEYRALLVHPTQNRVLILDYEYPVPPPGEEPEGDRLEQLMLVLEQVEPLMTEEAEPPSPEDAPLEAPPPAGEGQDAASAS